MAFSPRIFFDRVRAGILGPTLDAGEVAGCEAIIAAFAGSPIADVAYALGTAFLETGGTMQPIMERGGPKYFHRMYDIQGDRPKKARELGNLSPGDGVKYPGRGYPQTTGKRNYALAEKVFGIPFVSNPDLMMVSENAAKVMAHFMKGGLFTGKKLADFLPRTGPANLAQFKKSRPIINGTDRAADVAAFAMQFQTALQAGGYQ
jgi:putative chitinase